MVISWVGPMLKSPAARNRWKVMPVMAMAITRAPLHTGSQVSPRRRVRTAAPAKYTAHRMLLIRVKYCRAARFSLPPKKPHCSTTPTAAHRAVRICTAAAAALERMGIAKFSFFESAAGRYRQRLYRPGNRWGHCWLCCQRQESRHISARSFSACQCSRRAALSVAA